MMDPIVLDYGKGQLTGLIVDPKGVLDVVSCIWLDHRILYDNKHKIQVGLLIN